MKKNWIAKGLFAVLLAVSFNAHAVVWDDVTTAAGSSSIAVASTATVYTKSFEFGNDYKYFSAWYKATSDGTVNLKIELQQSYKRPTTEGAADVDWTVIEDTGVLESALADELAHTDRVFWKPMRFGRFKITGGTGNDASTIIKIVHGKD